MQGAPPSWLEEWSRAPCARDEAFRRFDALGPIEPEQMAGRWRGRGCPTGHPLDGVLERLGWYGKAFEPPDRAHPLLFATPAGGLVAIDPAFLPVRLPLHWPALARSAAARIGFAAVRPLLATTRPAATLRRVRYRGVVSTAMAYDRKPIVDHFRAISADTILGVMEAPRQPPYFFRLVRDRAVAGRTGAEPAEEVEHDRWWREER